MNHRVKENVTHLARRAGVATAEYACTVRGFRVVNTFDRDYWYHGGEKRLPNVPMRADKTLLAEMLKHGEHGGRYDRKANRNAYQHEPNRALTVRQSKRFLGKLLGIEIEFYPEGDTSRLTTSPLAVLTTDGSLTGSGGKELQKLTWVDATGRIAGLLGLPLKGRIRKDCGLHVHVDVRHLPTDDSGMDTSADVFTPERFTAAETYERLIGFYPQLKRLVPRSRLRNRYCRWRNSRTFGDRYCAINYQSFREHGTIEWRCQAGSLNKTKIEMWCLLCQHLTDYASRKANVIPTTWPKFTAILPEPIRSWCIYRKMKLAEDVRMTARIAEAMDAGVSSEQGEA